MSPDIQWEFQDPKMEVLHGSLNVPIEHHPTIRYMVYNGYYKVMSNIPKMGHLPTPVHIRPYFWLSTVKLHIVMGIWGSMGKHKNHKDMG